MLDIPDAVGHEAGVAHARNGDPLAAQLHLLDLAREQLLDLDRDVGVGRTFEQRAHLFGGHAAGVLARDLDEAVADLQSGAVGREALVGLCDDHAVALLPDQRPHAAVLAGGEELEIGHLLFGHVDRIGVEPPHHSFGGVGHQTVGVDLVDVVDRPIRRIMLTSVSMLRANPKSFFAAKVSRAAAPSRAVAVRR